MCLFRNIEMSKNTHFLLYKEQSSLLYSGPIPSRITHTFIDNVNINCQCGF